MSGLRRVSRAPRGDETVRKSKFNNCVNRIYVSGPRTIRVLLLLPPPATASATVTVDGFNSIFRRLFVLARYE